MVAFSCKLRCICPSCHAKRELIWAHWAAEELLEGVPHRQVVLTIPKRLRPYFRYDRALLGDLATCAWRTLRLCVLAYFDDEAAVPGAVGFIQTAGELLNFHPHLHLLVSDGVFHRGRESRALHVLRHPPDRAAVSRRGAAATDGQRADLSGHRRHLLSWRHSGFSVNADVKVPDRAAARLGRCMIRCPVVLDRMSFDEDTGEVLYRTRPSRTDHPDGPVERWDVYELIARVLDHLPTPNQQMTRYWGFYSNVARGRRRAAARRLAAGLDPDADNLSDAGVTTVPVGTDDEPHRRRARLSWAALIKKVYEIDPLLCSYCGGEMKIIAFITEHATVAHILKHIHMPPQQPEPLAHSPPLREELLYAS